LTIGNWQNNYNKGSHLINRGWVTIAYGVLSILLFSSLIMSEVGGITELQMLEAKVALLEQKVILAKDAENTSVCCSMIVASISSSQAKDGFLVTEGSAPNQFHTVAAPGEGGCCILS
jgi:hypothetical protein